MRRWVIVIYFPLGKTQECKGEGQGCKDAPWPNPLSPLLSESRIVRDGVM